MLWPLALSLVCVVILTVADGFLQEEYENWIERRNADRSITYITRKQFLDGAKPPKDLDPSSPFNMARFAVDATLDVPENALEWIRSRRTKRQAKRLKKRIKRGWKELVGGDWAIWDL
jgi:hypothetical protein